MRAGSNDYSVDPRFIGRIVAVQMNQEHVWVSIDGVKISRHERVWGAARTVTNLARVTTAARLRATFQTPRVIATDAEMVRHLSDYNTVLGMDFDPAGVFVSEGITSRALLTDAQREIAHLARALKAPRILAAAERGAPVTREANWSHEQYLAAVLSREVSTQEASVSLIRIKAAGINSVKTLEDFAYGFQQGAPRNVMAHLSTGAYLL